MRLRLLLCAVPLLIAAESRAEFYEKIVDDVFPAAVPRTAYTENHFQVIGAGALPEGTKVYFDPNSIQWSRVDERLVLPRARMSIEIPGVEGGNIQVWGRVTPLRRSESGAWVGEFLVPLVSGKASEVSVTWKKGKTEIAKTIRLERKPNETDEIGLDTSCSSSHPEIRRHSSGAAKPNGTWTYLDCRWIRETSGGKNSPALDLALFWDGQDDSLKVNGVAVRATAPSVFHLHLRPQAEPLTIETKDGQVYDLSYKLPSEFNLGFVGVGVGPYQYRLLSTGTDVSTLAPVLTLYGSYALGEAVKLTGFNVTTFNKNYFTDTGLYIKTDSFRFFDQRIRVYLMFGAHFFGFKFPDGAKFKGGIPQGFEAVFQDLLHKNYSATVGAFIYPKIEGKSFTNAWLRYGSASFFVELNYIALHDNFEGDTVYSKNVGVSFGFPLARLY